MSKKQNCIPEYDYSSFSTYIKTFYKYSKLPWIIGLTFTLVLLWGSEVQDDGGESCAVKNVHGGFCVTNYDCTGIFLKDPTFSPENRDSHELAGLVDLALLVVAIIFPILNFFGVKIFNIGEFRYTGSITAVLTAVALIGVHGWLHYFTLSESYKPPADNLDGLIDESDPMKETGFKILTVIIVVATLYGSSLPIILKSQAKMVGVIAIVSYAILQLVEGSDNNPISLFFTITQLLVTGVGTFFPDKCSTNTHKLSGWGFAATSLVSLLEFYACQSFLLKIGGHAWYDVMLHVSLLATYWDYTDVEINSKFVIALSLPLF